MYSHYSDVNDHEAPHFLSLRHIVLARKQPRKMFVQCNTSVNGMSLFFIVVDASSVLD